MNAVTRTIALFLIAATGTPALAQGDLTPTGLSCNHTVIHNGKQVAITSIVKNNDPFFATPKPANTAYILSDDIFLTTADVILDTFQNKALGPGQTDLVTRTVTIPDLIACKTYYIFVWVNYDAGIFELNRLNNTRMISVTGVVLPPSPTTTLAPNLGRLEIRHRIDGLAAVSALHPGEQFGTSMANAGDFNKDGYVDLVVGAPYQSSNATNIQTGAAYVFSGKDGSRLWAVQGVGIGQQLGKWVDRAGDVDNDGYADVLVSAGSTPAVFSGRTGQLLRVFQAIESGDSLDGNVAGIGDINGDGHDDVAVCGTGYPDSAIAYVMSGKDGKRLARLVHPRASIYDTVEEVHVYALGNITNAIAFAFSAEHKLSGLKMTIYAGPYFQKVIDHQFLPLGPHNGPITGCGDLDKDGFRDFVTSSSTSVHWFSGKTNKVLRSVGSMYNLSSLADIGDFDRDGYSDLAVAAEFVISNKQVPGVRVYSGKDAGVLAFFKHDRARTVASFGDSDRDGFPEIAIAAPQESPVCRPQAGTAWVFGIQPYLEGDVAAFSLANMNTLKLSLDAGSTFAGQGYWVLGSLTGTAPGLQLGGITLPLVFDPMTDLTMMLANSSIFVNTLGALDASGKAGARFVFGPSGQSSLIGRRIYFAFLTFGGGKFTMASNPIQLRLEK
ncbi:MAG: FG-GAP repeat protein [Planctomycetes bacterium]|nr:FG-GAP repeat protein [Planctomycetota bacterium]